MTSASPIVTRPPPAPSTVAAATATFGVAKEVRGQGEGRSRMLGQERLHRHVKEGRTADGAEIVSCPVVRATGWAVADGDAHAHLAIGARRIRPDRSTSLSVLLGIKPFA